MRAHGTFGTLVKFTTADVSLSKDVFDKAVKSALGRVNTRGISNSTQHQSKVLLNFLCGKDSFACLPTIANLPTGTKECGLRLLSDQKNLLLV